MTQVKPKCFDIGPKIHTETKTFNCFDCGYGFPLQIMTRHGLPYGFGCHFHPGIGWGIPSVWMYKIAKMALGVKF